MIFRWELECQKRSKIFCKIFERQNIKNKATAKYFRNPEVSFQAEHFLEKRNPKENSSKTTISKVLSKISIRKKTLKQQHNFCKAKSSLEVHGMLWETKFLRYKISRKM